MLSIQLGVLLNGNAHSIDTSNILVLIDSAYDAQQSTPELAFSLAKKAYQQSVEIGYIRGMGMSSMRMGSIFNKWGENDSALLFLKEALEKRKQIGDHRGAIGACMELSYAYNETGKLDSSYSMLIEALGICHLMEDSVSIVNLNLELGHFNTYYGDSIAALDFYNKALNTSKSISYEDGILKSYSGLANYYVSKKSFEKALTFYLRCESRLINNNRKSMEASTYNNIAVCYDELGEPRLAIKYFHKAYTLQFELNSTSEMAIILFNLGNLYSAIGMTDTASSLFIKSSETFHSLGNIKEEARCYQLLSEVEAQNNNYLKAYNYHIKYTDLSDSLLNSEKVNSLSRMRTEYDVERKEVRIELLDQENKAKKAQRNFFVAASLALLLVIVLLSFYYVYRFRIAKQKQQLSNQKIDTLLQDQEIKTKNALLQGQETERQRIASDLHDRLGGILSTVKLRFQSLEKQIADNQKENKTQFQKTADLVDEAVVEVRRISHNLSTGMVVSFGLVPALQELSDSIDSSGLVRVKMLTYGQRKNLETKMAIDIYRMVQEIFNNILKHAQCSQIIIQINFSEDSLNLTIEDNGIGFNPKNFKSKGLGLNSLNTRAETWNGTYHIDSSPGKGSISIIDIPFTNTEE